MSRKDGLVFYRKILSDYAVSLKKGGFILFGIGYDQEGDITALAELYGFDCQVKKDLSGKPRMAILKEKS